MENMTFAGIRSDANGFATALQVMPRTLAPIGYRILERVTPGGAYIVLPGLYESREAAEADKPAARPAKV